jgi:FixJ family two-component response regulator
MKASELWPALPLAKWKNTYATLHMWMLGLIDAGLSNREIAARLFVSENTVKTHSSRRFDKLGAKRRTQAVQFAKTALQYFTR